MLDHAGSRPASPGAYQRGGVWGPSAGPHYNRWRCWGLAALVVLASPVSAPAQVQVAGLKVEVIDRITQFVEWPEDVLAEGTPAFGLCVHGSSDTADHLVRLATTRKLKQRSCQVRRLRPGADPRGCHLLYIAGSEEARLPSILAAVAGRPILTVSDSAGFGERGVLVNLYPSGRYIRFEVNVTTLAQSKLYFSSKLLRLARLVEKLP
jgi:hypothetical protein